MSIKLRQWLACILMVLLPLQAYAAAQAVSCAEWMPNCPGMASGSDACCEHGINAKPADDQHAASGGHSSGMASCTGATTCAPLATAAALPHAESVLTISDALDSWLDMESAPFQSHISDGLRRPPRTS